MHIQLFRERLCQKNCVRNNPERQYGIYNQYTVPDTIAVESILLLFSFSIRKHMSTVSCAILSNFFEEQLVNSKPPTNYTFLDLWHALLPTTFLEIAVHSRKTSQEGPFKTSRTVIKRRKLGISPTYSKHGPWLLSKENRRKAWKIKVIFIISKWWCQVLQWQTTLISLHLTYMYNYSICYYLLTNSISVSNEIQHFTSFMTYTSRTIRQGPPHDNFVHIIITFT